MKDVGDRRSKSFHRRFTGAKGIGRLSAHKLAKLLQVDSVYGEPGGQSRVGISATIDWNAIEALSTLEEISEGREVITRPEKFKNKLTAGTRITLRRLRSRWTSKERTTFVAECRSFRPPDELTINLVPRLLSEPLIFPQPTPREKHADDPGFSLNLEGEFITGESLWRTITDTSQWLIEVDAAQPEDGQAPEVKFGIGPTNKTASEHVLGPQDLHDTALQADDRPVLPSADLRPGRPQRSPRRPRKDPWRKRRPGLCRRFPDPALWGAGE